MGSNGYIMVWYGGWDPCAQSDGSKSEQVRQCMDLQHSLHWLHLGPTHQYGRVQRMSRLEGRYDVRTVLVDTIQRIYDGR